ncbi:MAG: sigma-54 dependent transcriptional regulator [Ignavibacteria bacterium]|nr:MAG: sigma-54 dependent transcriptional regulator [Ignavibacteria bacterium]
MSGTKANILIIDDEERIRNVLSDIFYKKGFNTLSASNGEEGLKVIGEKDTDVALLDLVLPEMNGIEVLKKIKDIDHSLPVIMITAYGTVPNAVEAIKQGAFDFVEKPLDADKILVIIKNALEMRNLNKENIQLKKNVRDQFKFIGNSPQIVKIINQVNILASKNCNVLITGESGTGKEIVARNLHNLSLRVAQPFVKVNCAALPKELFESELFGYKRGAFTGAVKDQIGKFKAADGGTLFLDEIGELPIDLQPKLLQAIEDKKFYRLGDAKEIDIDVRVLSATNIEIEERIESGLFRKDLFYRLNDTSINIPPLRERIEDIPELINHFISIICDEYNTPVKEITNEAASLLLNYPWYGNVRELKHKLQEIIIYHNDKTIEVEDVKEWMEIFGEEIEKNDFVNDNSLRDARENFEREHILKTLIAYNWNVPAAANALGIERTNLYRKIKQLGITKENQKVED